MKDLPNVRLRRNCLLCETIIYSAIEQARYCYGHSAEYLNVFQPNSSRQDFEALKKCVSV